MIRSSYVSVGAFTEDQLIQRRDALLSARLARSGFCTTTNPQPGCTAVAGVAKPMTTTALGEFEQLQEQLNRLLMFWKKTPLVVDRRIGPAVMRAVGLVQISLGPIVAAAVLPYNDLDSVAQNAAAIRGVVSVIADDLHAPLLLQQFPPTTASHAGAAGTVVNPPDDVIAASAGVASSNPIVLIAAGAIAAALLFKGLKGRRRR